MFVFIALASILSIKGKEILINLKSRKKKLKLKLNIYVIFKEKSSDQLHLRLVQVQYVASCVSKHPLISAGNISAAKFTLNTVDENSVMVNITDPITSIHRQQKQLSIRDVLKKDLKYKISYYKSGSTGKVKYSVIASTVLIFSASNSKFFHSKFHSSPP